MKTWFFIENVERLLFFQSLVVDVVVVCYGFPVLSAYREEKGRENQNKTKIKPKPIPLFFKSCVLKIQV